MSCCWQCLTISMSTWGSRGQFYFLLFTEDSREKGHIQLFPNTKYPKLFSPLILKFKEGFFFFRAQSLRNSNMESLCSRTKRCFQSMAKLGAGASRVIKHKDTRPCFLGSSPGSHSYTAQWPWVSSAWVPPPIIWYNNKCSSKGSPTGRHYFPW